MVDGGWRRLAGEAITAAGITVGVFLVATAVVETDEVWVLGLISMILGYSLAHSLWEFM